MKTSGICCLTIVLLFTVARAQPESGVVDQFGKIGCDDFLARADSFFHYLSENTGVQGYFVISANDEDWRATLAYQQLLDGAIAERSYDRSRIVTVRAPKTGAVGAAFFWISGAARPSNTWLQKWDVTLPLGTKPFMLGTDFGEMCWSPLNVSRLKEYLAANAGSQVHAVIHADTKRDRTKGLAEAKKTLSTIPADRTRYFFKRLHGYGSGNDYWFVPAK